MRFSSALCAQLPPLGGVCGRFPCVPSAATRRQRRVSFGMAIGAPREGMNASEAKSRSTTAHQSTHPAARRSWGWVGAASGVSSSSAVAPQGGRRPKPFARWAEPSQDPIEESEEDPQQEEEEGPIEEEIQNQSRSEVVERVGPLCLVVTAALVADCAWRLSVP